MLMSPMNKTESPRWIKNKTKQKPNLKLNVTLQLFYRPVKRRGLWSDKAVEGSGAHMGDSCMELHCPKWHMHLGAICNSEENLLMVNLSDRAKFHSLKYERVENMKKKRGLRKRVKNWQHAGETFIKQNDAFKKSLYPWSYINNTYLQLKFNHR